MVMNRLCDLEDEEKPMDELKGVLRGKPHVGLLKTWHTQLGLSVGRWTLQVLPPDYKKIYARALIN